MHEYENTTRITYSGGATFVPRCTKCGRFVRANVTIKWNEESGLKDEPNANCSNCGDTKMIFEGFM